MSQSPTVAYNKSKNIPNAKSKKPQLKKVLTVANIQNQQVKRIEWDDRWYQAFGNPQDRGVWFVWGTSGSGKSTFVMDLAKALAARYKTFYNLLEEETDDTDYIDRTEVLEMHEVADNFHTQSYTFRELKTYLNKRNAPQVIIVDSITYLTKDWNEYMELKRLITKKNMILIVVGHAEGKHPRTEFEKSIRYDAKMKIYVSGYLAICQGRTIGPNGGRFITYQEGYEKLHSANPELN